MSDYLDPNNEELLKDFFSEAQMQVDTLEQNILVLENEGGNRDAVDEIFRAAHTLKGGAATVEMMELSHFTHLVEDVLDAIRSDAVAINEDVVDTLLAAIDIIKAMITQRMDGAVYQENTSEIEGRLSSLLPEGSDRKKTKSAAAKPQPSPAVAAAAPSGGTSAPKTAVLSEYELLELKEAVDGSMPIYRIAVQFDENSLMNTVGGIQVYAALKSYGTILKTVPDFEKLYEDNFYPTVDYYIATNKTAEELKRYVIIPDVSLNADVSNINEIARSPEAPAKPAQPAAAPVQARSAQTQAAQAPAAPVPAAPKAPAAPHPEADEAKAGGAAADAKKAGKEAGSILRVDSKRIDDLLNLVSETVITKATFNQISNQFKDLLNELHALETSYRDRIKNLFDSLPDYLESIQGGRSIKE
ncbi:MAG: Hpt domain-containing protein, partial [Treponema sp.]|nr:Hpt domain-containing protein [Treponema sp.]